LSPGELLGLAVFLVPSYLAARSLWGRQDQAPRNVASLAVTVQVGLFLILRQYSWFDVLGWLEHPVSVIGLSYILFRQIHLVLEAPHLGHLPFNGYRYLCYTLAFWTLLSGPIQRYEPFCNGLASVKRPDDGESLEAAHRLVNGLIKAYLIAPIFLSGADIDLLKRVDAGWLDFAIVFYCFPIYLYLSFSGYTDVVIALARLCGITTMPENFNRPYLARNVQDFWSRWHMSFSSWIQHYLFNPLAKELVSRGGTERQAAMMSLALLVTFVIIGLWHGTTANFAVFGVVHGIAVFGVAVLGVVLKKRLGKKGRRDFESRVHPFSIFLTFHYIAASLMLFNNSLATLADGLGTFFS